MRNSIIIREEENLEFMLQLAAKAGFKEIMLGFGTSDILLRKDYHNDIEKIKLLMDKYGIACRQTHFPFYHLLVSSEVENEEIEDYIKRGIEASDELGAEWGCVDWKKQNRSFKGYKLYRFNDT